MYFGVTCNNFFFLYIVAFWVKKLHTVVDCYWHFRWRNLLHLQMLIAWYIWYIFYFVSLLSCCGFCFWLLQQRQQLGVGHLGWLVVYGSLHHFIGPSTFQLLIGVYSFTGLGMHVLFILNKHCIHLCLKLLSYVDSNSFHELSYWFIYMLCFSCIHQTQINWLERSPTRLSERIIAVKRKEWPMNY